MARLHEYQGKSLLAKAGIPIPKGGPANSPDAAANIARSLLSTGAKAVVVKIQAWTTGRAAIGGIAFADTPESAAAHAARMLAMTIGNFPVSEVLIEEKITIAREAFLSISIDDRERAPIVLLSLGGGSGIEDRASQVARFICDVDSGPDLAAIKSFLAASDLSPPQQASILNSITPIFRLAAQHEARSVEINPLALLPDHSVLAADCRITIDDYAIAGGRHPDLGIDIARELDHPPTPLERIAYEVERADHRGTFYFAQMNTVAQAPGQSPSSGLIGFHGAGGGGSMMSMDAITAQGFTIANFCDTSGNPSPAKVYRAARIILSQPGLIGYFGSGSGVANQEQYWSAYGLAKAFWELELNIPAVIRLGGNTEDRAVDILHSATKDLPAPIEGYKKTDSPAKVAARLAELIHSTTQNRDRKGAGPTGANLPATPPATLPHPWQPRLPRRPDFVGKPSSISFPLKSARLWIDPAAWSKNAAAIIARSASLLSDNQGRPTPTLPPDAFASKDSEMIACEVECRRDGINGLFVELGVPGLDEPAAQEAR